MVLSELATALGSWLAAREGALTRLGTEVGMVEPRTHLGFEDIVGIDCSLRDLTMVSGLVFEAVL